MSRRFTEAEIAEVWERRKSGEPTRSIARRSDGSPVSRRGQLLVGWVATGRRSDGCLRMLVGYLRHRGGEPSGT